MKENNLEDLKKNETEEIEKECVEVVSSLFDDVWVCEMFRFLFNIVKLAFN